MTPSADGGVDPRGPGGAAERSSGGRRGPVWVVASEGTARRWAAGLLERGWPALALPWSTLACVDAERDLAILLAAGPPDLVCLTSRQAVRCLPATLPRDLGVACVGEGTAREAAAAGLAVHAVGPGTGEALAHLLLARAPVPRRVLLLRGEVASDVLAGALSAAGVHVEELVVYAARARDGFPGDLGRAPPPAAVVVGSPAAARALWTGLAAAGRAGTLAGTALVAIGEPTRARLAALGHLRARAAASPDVPGLSDALATALRADPSGPAGGRVH